MGIVIENYIFNNLRSLLLICIGAFESLIFIKNTLLLPRLNLTTLTKEVVSYKSKVLEWGQQNKKDIKFKILQTTGKDHKKFYKVVLLLEGETIAEGDGSSIKRAEEHASQKAQTQLLHL